MVEYVRNDSISIPSVGFGLWKVTNEAECKQSIEWALEAGYRHFDTAQAYGNEKWVGDVLSKATVPRQELFVTTKIGVENFGKSRTLKSFEKSYQNLQLDYVDLLLLHFPVPLLRGNSWKALEEIHASGRVKHIGVSNFTVKHLEALLKDCAIQPAVNQVELHVFLQQPELLEYCRVHNILVEAYSPLAHGNGLDDPTLAEIGRKYGKTPSQIMLRWCVESGTVPLPKSVHQDRIAQNLDILDFKLDEADMAAIKPLNKDLRTCWDPTHIP